MAGTVAPAARRALYVALTALTVPAAALEGVAVAYSYNSRLLDAKSREILYGGQTAGPTAGVAMRGSARIKREEKVGHNLHIEVTIPGAETTETADTRCGVIGAVVENLLASDYTLGGVTGLLSAQIDNVEMDGFCDDDAAFAIWTYRVVFHSYLT